MSDAAVLLLVEDNADDAFLLRRAFVQCNIINPLHIVKNGREALRYLEGTGDYANRRRFPMPKIVLLDLKLPDLDGFEVLRRIRHQPDLAALRVIILSSSGSINDVNLAYELGANSFLVKPSDLNELARLADAIRGYWIWMDQAPELPLRRESTRTP